MARCTVSVQISVAWFGVDGTGFIITRRKQQRPGTAKEHNKPKNTYIQPKRTSIGTTHRPSTGHHRKSSPRVNSHNARQHRNPWAAPHRPIRVVARVLSANAIRCASQAGRAALLHRHHPHHRGHAAPTTRGAHHPEELVVSHGHTASLRGGGGRGERGDERTGGQGEGVGGMSEQVAGRGNGGGEGTRDGGCEGRVGDEAGGRGGEGWEHVR